MFQAMCPRCLVSSPGADPTPEVASSSSSASVFSSGVWTKGETIVSYCAD